MADIKPMTATWLRAVVAFAVAAFAALTSASTAVEAAGSGASASGSVKACSRFGQSCITAPVRQGPRGMEVRLPGGTWMSCSGDCRETLRAETIDFFDEKQIRENTM